MRRRFALTAMIGCAAGPLALSIICPPPIVLVWNASGSAPIGLYRVHAGRPIRSGDMVVARLTGPAGILAARRLYLPARVPVVKRVAAVAGEQVCARRALVTVGGRPVALRRRFDPEGRPMPWWSGCRRLGSGEYFLLMPGPLSFDGRYFGVTRGNEIIGPALLLWSKPTKRSGSG
jgi:type IV secretory pathway protease TraF